MPVHRWFSPSSMLPVPIYTPGRIETKCSKFPCLRKQSVGQGLNPEPPDPEFKFHTRLLKTVFIAWKNAVDIMILPL